MKTNLLIAHVQVVFILALISIVHGSEKKYFFQFGNENKVTVTPMK